MNVEQIQTMVNTYISTNLGKIKQSMSKEYYNSVPKEYINLIKEINVEIKNDKFYSNDEHIDGYDLDLECDDTFVFKGLGHITVNCIWNTTKEDFKDMFESIIPVDVNGQADNAYIFQHRKFSITLGLTTSHWFILETLYKYVFRFLGIEGHKSFIVAHLKHFNRNNMFFKHDILEDYDSYPWATICPGENKYWVKVDTTKLNESEDNPYKLSGRNYTINPDGTISIEDNTKKFVKIRLSVPILNANINIKELKPSDNGFILTSKNGTEQDISMEIVTTVLNFVDNGKPGEIKSKNPFKPNIKLTKV